jgi:general secretion pathway protein H
MTFRRREANVRPAAGGFTLIETIVVLAILGLTVSIVVGFLPRRNGTLELDNATALVVGAMRIARSHAIAGSRPVLFAATQDGHGIQTDQGRLTLGSSVWVATPARRAILFAPDGGASGGPLRVLVADKTRLIQVDWLTGRITISNAL